VVGFYSLLPYPIPVGASEDNAISRAKKTEKVQLLAKELETSTTAIIGTFSKLTVAKDYELRKVIRRRAASIAW